MSTIYINAPFAEAEYEAIAALAEKEGRSKGKQLRELALKAIGFDSPAKPAPRKPAKKGAAR